MPVIRDIVWTMRDEGQVEILQKGKVLGKDVGVGDVVGPIRVRKKWCRVRVPVKFRHGPPTDEAFSQLCLEARPLVRWKRPPT
jgi:hypothetical protein